MQGDPATPAADVATTPPAADASEAGDLDDDDELGGLEIKSPTASEHEEQDEDEGDEEDEEECDEDEELLKRGRGKSSTTTRSAGKGKGTGKGKGKAKGKAKAKGQTRKQGEVTFKCRGCDKNKDESHFHSGSVYCVPCRSMMDSLTRLAAAQGEKEWWQETRNNPKLLKAALKSYHEEAPAMPTGSKTKRPKWNILQYKDTLTAASKVQFAERGNMMTRKRYLWWAQTPEGGKLTEQEAEDQWREWEGQPDDGV